MRRLAVSLVAAAALSGAAIQTASAADIPAPVYKAPVIVAPVFDWSGFYIGLQAGYGWGDHDRSLDAGTFSNSYTSNGALVGIHGGYNWQINQFVLGIEADINWSGIKGDDAGVGGTTDETATRWIGSVRGRAGVAFNQLLVFGTVGWGFADLRHNNPAGVPADNSFTRSGLTAGAGFQWAFTPNLSAGVEYRHYWLGSYSVAPAGLAPFSVDSDISTVTGRLTYRFGR